MKILVLDASALHLGFLGCYGNDWVATPNLDRLANQGIVYDWHFVETPEIELDPAIALECAGVRVQHLCVRKPSFSGPVIRELTEWSRTGRDVLWVGGPHLAPPWKLPEDLLTCYFDEEEDDAPWSDPPQGMVSLTDDDRLRLHNTYAAVITHWDAQLGDLLEAMDTLGLAESVAVMVTARSGLPLGEHGQIGFTRPCLHEEIVHVPLVIRMPAQAGAGRRCAGLTQPADLLHFFQAALEGKPTLWLPTDRTEVISSWTMGDEQEWALRTQHWALLWPRTNDDRPVQLYAKPDDRWEVNNLAQHHLDMVEEWQKLLETRFAAKR